MCYIILYFILYVNIVYFCYLLSIVVAILLMFIILVYVYVCGCVLFIMYL